MKYNFARKTFFTFFIGFIFVVGRVAQGDNAAYRVAPPPLSVPSGSAGEVRRIISQFDSWTLICDENRRQHTGICNVSQVVFDAHDLMIFSWSLVTSKDGRPFVLLRTLSTADIKRPIELYLPGQKAPLRLAYKGCEGNVCLAQAPVGPLLSQAIKSEVDVRIRYWLRSDQSYDLQVPFKGLSAAINSL
ncbi:invasion associated locus B family protein [Bartonella sp. DGB2]|uniref:invasion associated locus B family protein n=1 Tax=Bartonella sp. DGB2 TaxID=3388426 RepID=UPI00398FBBCA